MYCSKCGNQIQDGDKFCPLCGSPATTGNIPASGSKSDSSKLIVIWAIIFLSSILLTNIIPLVVSDWYFSSWKYVYYGITTIRTISNLLPVLAIKRKGAKITFLILFSIYILYSICYLVYNLMIANSL